MMKSLIPMLMMLISGCSNLGFIPSQTRDFSTTVTDSRIKLNLLDKWRALKSTSRAKPVMIVHKGRVLIAGRIPEVAQQIETVRLAWETEGVREVIDKMTVGEPLTFAEYSHDSLISSKLKTSLTFNPNIFSTNFEYKTFESIIYLLGTAKTEDERLLVVQAARNVSSVKDVVYYIDIMDPEPTDVSQKDDIKVTEIHSFIPQNGEVVQQELSSDVKIDDWD